MSSVLPPDVTWRETEFKLFVTVPMPASVRADKCAVRADLVQCRLAASANAAPFMQGLWALEVANVKVHRDKCVVDWRVGRTRSAQRVASALTARARASDGEQIVLELLKGASKQSWATLFRGERESVVHELRRAVRAAGGASGVDLAFEAGDLVAVLVRRAPRRLRVAARTAHASA